MATMYELTEDYLSLLDLADDPDVPADSIADTMEAIETEIEIKADNVARILREMSARSDALKAEEQRMAAKRRDLEAKHDALKKRLEEMMRKTGKTKFKTDLFSFSIQKNGGKIPIIMDVETADLPDDLVIVSEKPDLEAIRAYIEKHGTSPYAHYGERGESLRIK